LLANSTPVTDFCAHRPTSCMTEQGDEPWVAPSVPPAPLWKEVLAFMTSSATGAADFVMAFDGRMREVRRLNAT